MSTEELLAQVLGLPRSERARVAEEVLSSLEEPDDQVAEAWSEELRRRSRDVADGRVPTVDWASARAEILQELERRRAARLSS
jgi:putative addiction module component (TIGR02574 family)